jgi:hypothetical protein
VNAPIVAINPADECPVIHPTATSKPMLIAARQATGHRREDLRSLNSAPIPNKN